jgi:hypothetical protein
MLERINDINPSQKRKVQKITENSSDSITLTNFGGMLEIYSKLHIGNIQEA